MRSLLVRGAFVLAACAFLAGSAGATSVTSNIPVTGNFQSTIQVSGNATLNSASGTFKQWLLFTHANIGVTASSQTAPVSLTSNPNVNVNGGGTVNLTYDDATPGTPQALTQGPPNAMDIDINGSTSIPFDLAVGNININTSLGTFQLQLTVDADITDLTFLSSTTTSIVGNNYFANGTLAALLNGNVNGTLVNVPILGTVNLGTLYTLVDAPLSFAIPLPGVATTTDLEGGVPPFPNDMQADFQLSVPGIQVPFPFTQPILLALSQTVPNGQSGFSVLNVDATLNATITLADPQYLYSGVVSQTLVPEPSVALLLGAGLSGLAVAGRRRR
jgi:hypothetical protein